jgi:hypothetical protein
MVLEIISSILVAKLILLWGRILDYGGSKTPNKKMTLMKYFLSVDYVLSLWFSRTTDKIIPGAAFLFLNKVAFMWASIFFLVTGILNTKMSIGLYVGILVLVGGAIMYGFQKKMEILVQEMNFDKTLKISKQEIIKKRLLGLFYFALSFATIFIVVLIFH